MKDKRQITPAGRIARIIVWTTFVMALIARFAFFRNDQQSFNRFDRPIWQGQQQPRFYHPPTSVRPPVSPIPPDLPRIAIEIAPKDVETLRGYFWSGWGRQPANIRPEVSVTVREGEMVYTNVALHLKGAAGSFRPFDDKPALTLNFGKRVKGRKFHGYSKVSLNNSVQDPTFLCEAISRELYNSAGVPAPNAEWATVLINQRDLGLYVMVEGYGKDFLKRHFKNVKGNLYDGGFCRDVNQGLDVNSGDNPDDRSDLSHLFAAAMPLSSNTRRGEDRQMLWKRLSEVLDMDRFISFLALEVFTCNWDGYGMNKNNYRLFHDLDTDRMVFMPHGMDQMFDWPHGRFPPDASIHPNMRGVVARAALSSTNGSRLFLERLDSLRTNVFQEERLIGRVREMAQHIRPTLAAYDPGLASRHDAMVSSLCDRISRRIQSVNEQVTEELSRPKESLDFDASGTASLPQWTKPYNKESPNVLLDQIQENGRTLLHLDASHASGTASWRTPVFLQAGQYRFQGRARVTSNNPGARVALRISGTKLRGTVVPGSDWISLSHRFVVDQDMAEIVLVCEFTGTGAEAWFDVDSLRLVRE